MSIIRMAQAQTSSLSTLHRKKSYYQHSLSQHTSQVTCACECGPSEWPVNRGMWPSSPGNTPDHKSLLCIGLSWLIHLALFISSVISKQWLPICTKGVCNGICSMPPHMCRASLCGLINILRGFGEWQSSAITQDACLGDPPCAGVLLWASARCCSGVEVGVSDNCCFC